MPNIESRRKLSDPNEMLLRTLIFNDMYEYDPERAENYWRFVERGYAERGFEPDEIEQLIGEADETLASMTNLGAENI